MRRYILKRLLQLIPVLLGVTFLSFAMMRLAGSDAITELYGDKGAVSQEIIDAKRAELGLDRPFLSQYFSWLGAVVLCCWAAWSKWAQAMCPAGTCSAPSCPSCRPPCC